MNPWMKVAAGLCMAAMLLANTGNVRAGSYADFARGLLENPHSGAVYRPDLERVLDNLANAYRGTKKSKPLKPSDTFLAMARAHAADMLLNDFTGHRSSTGHDFAMRVEVMRPEGQVFRSIAENAARDRQKGAADETKARRLFQQWIDSRPHRKALLNKSYAYVSSGVVQRGNVIAAVQIFWGEPRKQDGLFFQ